MPSQTLFGQSHTPRARLDLSPNTHSHKRFWHQNSRSVMQLWAYAAVIQETFPGTFSSQLFQIFKLDECFWNHFAFDSLCMVCGSAKRLHLLHNWNRLDLEKLRESTIAYCLIWACVTFSPPLPEESPLWKDSSGNWWVQMWKYFTTLLALSKESLCHLLLVIIPGWGIGGWGFPGQNMMSLCIFSDSAYWLHCSSWVGGQWSFTGSNLPFILDPHNTEEVLHYTSCELVFSWEKRYIVTCSQLLKQVSVMKQKNHHEICC